MFKNYVTVAIRNLRRSPGYSLINIVGLATGLAAFMLILLFVQKERSYDKHHDQPENIYRVILDAALMGQDVKTTNTSIPLAPTLVADYPEVLFATRIDKSTSVLIERGTLKFSEPNFYVADSSIFDIFSIALVAGQSNDALNRPFAIILSEDMATKYFGASDPMGQTLIVGSDTDYEVTGVFKQQEGNSHLTPDFIGSFISRNDSDSEVWLDNSYLTYIRLTPGANPALLESKFPEMVRKYVGPQVQQMLGQNLDEAYEAGFKYDFVLENVSDIYLHSDAQDQVSATGNIQYVYTLAIIGLFILVIACINFTNLSTARASNRAREVGMRKVLGSARSQLVIQFLAESLLLALTSMLIAIVLVYTALPIFNSTLGSNLTLGLSMIWATVGVAILTGILAGLYPAVVLSNYRPITVLKGNFNSGFKGSRLRSSLVVFQFAISIALLIGTSVVFKQLDFLQNQDLGFSKEQVVVLPIESNSARASFDSFRNVLLENPGIVDVAASGAVPGPDHVHNVTVFKEGGKSPDDIFLAARADVSYDFVDVLGIEMLSGRNFSRDFPSDSSSWIINEAAAAQMGLSPEEVLGKILEQPDGEDTALVRSGLVVGVMKDFHYDSFHTIIEPIIFELSSGDTRYLPIRFRSDYAASTISFLEAKWPEFEPTFPFRYFFLDTEYAQFYEQENRLGKLYSSFTGLAIIIACLGLFGLASYVTSQRTKEIGVRKVLGASVGKIVVLLSKEFTRLVLIACVIAFPLAWFAMDRWLQEFAYATNMGWIIFAGAGITAVLIAWLTVGFQSIKAALADPITSLRTE